MTVNSLAVCTLGVGGRSDVQKPERGLVKYLYWANTLIGRELFITSTSRSNPRTLASSVRFCISEICILRNKSSVIIINVDYDNSTALHLLKMLNSYFFITFNPYNPVWEEKEQKSLNEGMGYRPQVTSSWESHTEISSVHWERHANRYIHSLNTPLCPTLPCEVVDQVLGFHR